MDEEKKPNKKFIHKLSVILIIFVLLEKGLSWKTGDFSTSIKTANHTPIPEIPDQEQNPVVNSQFPEEDSETKKIISHYVYYIKFYGSGKNIQSRLVRVKRNFQGNTLKRAKLILRELQIGPNEEEAKRGLITTLPQEEKIVQKMKLKNGILHISFTHAFEKNSGKLILQDRIDQINYSLFELTEIKGIVYYVNKKHVTTLGTENLQIPKIFYKGKRNFITLKTSDPK